LIVRLLILDELLSDGTSENEDGLKLMMMFPLLEEEKGITLFSALLLVELTIEH
jgi:hypothetical protein